MSEPGEAQSQDLQEARSVRFVLNISIGLLASGAWALAWHDPEQGGVTVEVISGLDSPRLMELARIDAQHRADWDAKQEARRAEFRAEAREESEAGGVAPASAEDMGL